MEKAKRARLIWHFMSALSVYVIARLLGAPDWLCYLAGLFYWQLTDILDELRDLGKGS
jgi:hypothetical protein